MSGVVVPEGERVQRWPEVISLLGALYLLGRIVSVWMLALVLWQGAQIAGQAARVYQTCGYIYVEAEVLPRCMRELIAQRHWIDLIW